MVEHIDELLRSVKHMLYARQGKFYPNKDFGSLLRLAEYKEPMLDYALSYARQAVDKIDGAYVKGVAVEGSALVFDILINDEEGRVTIEL